MNETEKKNIPDIFTFFSGEKVKTAADWKRRRAELLDWFERNVFGVYPEGSADGFTFDVDEEREYETYVRRTVTMAKGGYRAPFTLFLPRGAKKPPVIIAPVLQAHEPRINLDDPCDYEKKPSFTVFPIDKALAAGIAVAPYFVRLAAPDSAGGEKAGLNAELIKGERRSDSPGAIAAWSFFARRMADYLIADGTVAADKICMAGHSRGGKTTLLTAATDERFRLAYVSNSGNTGAAIARGTSGETIKDILRFTHWFCPEYYNWGGRENELPVDFHEFCALVAPRLLYVTSSTRDAWACPENEFLSCRLASRVYEDIYGVDGLIAPDSPAVDEVYRKGNLAYHIKTGDHSFDCSDWDKLIACIREKLM